MTVPNAMQSIMGPKIRDIFTVLSFQLILLILFGVFVRYEKDSTKYDLKVYPMFQDVHVMIFIGFGFLMTFLKRYSFSSVGFNFLLAAIIVQWAIVCEGFYHLDADHQIKINMKSLLRADIASAAVLISMGAVLGNTTYVQLIAMGIIEIAIFTGNAYLGTHVFQAVDAGDSIFVHAFGAYFGLAVSFVLGRMKPQTDLEDSTLEGSSYTSDLFAMIGTIFLWMFWPSFNSAELEGGAQMRAVINTYLSLTSCCVTSYAISSAMTPSHKFDMVHIQNSTLAGGVAIGTSANLLIQPYGAIIVGIVAGALSVFGYSILTPFLNKTFKVHDTCGVHNLHGMPGVLAGLIGALMAGMATEDQYHMELYELYPARMPSNATENIVQPFLTPGDGRTTSQQAGYQILAVIATVIIALISGLLTGIIVSTISKFSPKDAYADDPSWLMHETTPTKSESINVDISCPILPPIELNVSNLSYVQ